METYVYRVDADDRIIGVSDNWDDFAAANNGLSNCISAHVIGHKVWSYFGDPESIIIYQRLFHQAREENREIVLPVHCDSLETVRRLDIHIIPLENRHLEIHCKIRSSRQRKLPPVDESRAETEKILQMCSYCGHVKNREGTYVDMSELIKAEDLFERQLPRISHGICEACVRKMTKHLKLNKPTDS